MAGLNNGKQLPRTEGVPFCLFFLSVKMLMLIVFSFQATGCNQVYPTRGVLLDDLCLLVLSKLLWSKTITSSTPRAAINGNSIASTL